MTSRRVHPRLYTPSGYWVHVASDLSPSTWWDEICENNPHGDSWLIIHRNNPNGPWVYPSGKFFLLKPRPDHITRPSPFPNHRL